MSANRVVINCDYCLWSKEVDWKELPKRKNKHCPECNEVVINSYDKALWCVIEVLRKLKIIRISPPKTKKGVTEIRINTAPDTPLFTIKQEKEG